MASDGRIELELTVKDNASGQVNSIVSDIEHKVNRASGDVKIGLKASDEASKVIDEVKDKTEKGAEGKATLKADDQATSVINAAKENTEKGAEGKATIKADDQASDTIKTVREDYEKGAEGKATVTGDNSDAAGAMARTRTDYERGAEGKATVTGDDEATATLTGVRTDYEAGAAGTATITANVTDAKSGIDDVSTAARNVEGGTSTITAETSGAKGDIDDVSTAARNVEDGTSTITAETSGAKGDIDDVSTAARNVEGGTSVITADVNGALSAISEVQEALNNLSNTPTQVGVGADGSGAPDGGGNSGGGSGSGIGGKIAGAVWDATKSAVSGVFSAGIPYEYKLQTVGTLAKIGNPEADLDAFGEAMMQIAAESGQDIGTLLDAAYNALSSNVSWGNDAQGTDLQNYIRNQAMLAIAGRTDVNTAQNATSALANMYRDPLANNPEFAARVGEVTPERIAEMMVKGAYKGRMTVGELATSMSGSMSTAAAMGIAPEDITAMYAVLTQTGMSTNNAETSINRIIQGLSDRGSDAEKYMQKALGKNGKFHLQDAIDSGLSLMQILTAMGEYGAKNRLTLKDMFSLSIAGRGAQALYNSKDYWAETQNYMYNGDALFGATYDMMLGTTATSLDRIKQQFKAYGIELYKALAPSVQKVLEVVTGDKFQLAMARITNKISHLLSNDRVKDIIDGLVDAANGLLDVISGKKSLGELLSGWMSGLKEVADQFMGWVRDGMVDLMNDFIDTIPKSLQEKFGIRHLETTAEKKARLEKEARMRELYGGEFYGNEGNFLLTNELTEEEAETARQAIETLDDNNTTYADFIAALSGTPDEWMNTVAHGATGDSGLLELIDSGKVRVLSEEEVAEKHAEAAAIDERDRRIQEAYGVLGRNEIYDYASYKGIKNVGGEEYEAVKGALQYLSQHGEQGWWNAGQEEYRKGEYTADSAVYAALEADLSATGTSAEDAAAGMDDAAREVKRLGSGASDTVSFLSSLSSAAGDAAAKLSNVHYAGYLHAVGLDRVPYDNYPALLHKGEMVLTAAEASAYRFGGTGSSGGGFDVNGLASAIAGMAVQMDGKTVGRLVERSVSQEQGVRYNRQARKG